MALPFEQQPEESSKAFGAFVVYRNLGPERTLSAVARKIEKSNQLMGRWSKRYNWKARAAAWDAEADKRALELQVKEIAEMRDRHAGLAGKIQKIVDHEIDLILQAINNGWLTGLSRKEVLAFAEFATKLERLTRGEPDSIVADAKAKEGKAKRESLRDAWGDPKLIKSLQDISKAMRDKNRANGNGNGSNGQQPTIN